MEDLDLAVDDANRELALQCHRWPSETLKLKLPEEEGLHWR